MTVNNQMPYTRLFPFFDRKKNMAGAERGFVVLSLVFGMEVLKKIIQMWRCLSLPRRWDKVSLV